MNAKRAHSRFGQPTVEETKQLISGNPETHASASNARKHNVTTISIDPETSEISFHEHLSDTETHSKSKSRPFDESNLLGADTFAGAAMILIGTIMYGILGILNRLSMLGKSSTPYQSAAAMEVAEFSKFVVTALLLINEEGVSNSFRSIKMVPFSEWFFFVIPAAIYSITNNLDFYILQYMDPGSMQVVPSMKSMNLYILRNQPLIH